MEKNSNHRGNKLVIGFILLFSAFLGLLSILGSFGKYGDTFNKVVWGLFGQSLYALYFSLFALGVMLILNKYLQIRKNLLLMLSLLIFNAVIILNVATTHVYIDASPVQYILNIYNYGYYTAGGAFTGTLISLPLIILGYPITLIVCILIFILLSFLTYKIIPQRKIQEIIENEDNLLNVSKIENDYNLPVYEIKADSSDNFYNPYNEMKKKNRVYEKENIEKEIETNENTSNNDYFLHLIENNKPTRKLRQEKAVRKQERENNTANLDNINYYINNNPTNKNISSRIISKDDVDVDDSAYSHYEENFNEDAENENTVVFNSETLSFKERKDVEKHKEAIDPKIKKNTYVYKTPSLDILSDIEEDGVSDDAIKEKLNELNEFLDLIHYNAKVVAIIVGPNNIRFELKVSQLNINSIASHKTLLESKLCSPVVLHVPIKNKSTIGIDIKSPVRKMVSFKEMISDEAFWKDKGHTFVVGKHTDNTNMFYNIEDMPHMLVTGTTGSGKSVSLNNILCSLILKHDPEDLKMVIIDPKKMDFGIYGGIPHLIFKKILTEVNESRNVLSYLVDEMEKRSELLGEYGASNLTAFNKENPNIKLPFILILIDEYNDIVMQNPEKDIATNVLRIAQRARAVGIHLIIATQRPSTDVITGTLKNNLDARMALRASSNIDSRVAIDVSGAEDLLKYGDMLFKHSGSELDRLQAPYISKSEVKAIISYIKENNNCEFDENMQKILTISNNNESALDDMGGSGLRSLALSVADKNLAISAFDILMDKGGPISISYLQQSMTIGYPKAARIVNWFVKSKCAELASDGKKSFIVSRDEFLNILESNNEKE